MSKTMRNIDVVQLYEQSELEYHSNDGIQYETLAALHELIEPYLDTLPVINMDESSDVRRYEKLLSSVGSTSLLTMLIDDIKRLMSDRPSNDIRKVLFKLLHLEYVRFNDTPGLTLIYAYGVLNDLLPEFSPDSMLSKLINDSHKDVDFKIRINSSTLKVSVNDILFMIILTATIILIICLIIKAITYRNKVKRTKETLRQLRETYRRMTSE